MSGYRATAAFSPEQEALLADFVDLTLLVVFDTLGPTDLTSVARWRDFAGLIAVLDPHVVVRVDEAGARPETRGTGTWAKGAIAYAHSAKVTSPALINGDVDAVVAPRGQLIRVLHFSFVGERSHGLTSSPTPAIFAASSSPFSRIRFDPINVELPHRVRDRSPHFVARR